MSDTVRICDHHGPIENENRTTRNRCRKCVNAYRTKQRRKHGVCERRKKAPFDIQYQNIRSAIDRYQQSCKGRFRVLNMNAKSRGLAVSLTLDEYTKLVTSETCYYCDGVLPEKGGGLDRLDSNLGYFIGNVVPCCALCNFIKGKVSSARFLSQVEKIYIKMFSKRGAGNVASDPPPTNLIGKNFLPSAEYPSNLPVYNCKTNLPCGSWIR